MADQDWEPYKQEIKQLYIHEARPLSEVMSHLSFKYSFNKSEQQYGRRLAKWSFSKKNSQNQRWASRRVEKRKRVYGKASVVSNHGIQIPPKKLSRAKYGVGYVSALEYNAPSPQTPEGVEVWTPASSPEPGIYLTGDLPWFRFRRIFQLTTEQDKSPKSSSSQPTCIQNTDAISRQNFRIFLQSLCSLFTDQNSANVPESKIFSLAVRNLQILMPEEFAGQHNNLLCPMSNALRRGERTLLVILYLLSNHIEPYNQWGSEVFSIMKPQILGLLKYSVENQGALTPSSSKLSFEPTFQAVAESLFAHALEVEDARIVELLLRSGTDPNGVVKIKPHGPLTPLQYAAMSSNLRLVDLLISHGADVNGFTECSDLTALYYGIAPDDKDLVQTLLSNGANPTPSCFTELCRIYDDLEWSDILEEFITAFPDVNARIFDPRGYDDNDSSALAVALHFCQSKVVEMLIEAGAIVDGSLFPIYFDELPEFLEGFLGLKTTALGLGVIALYTDTSIDVISILMGACVQLNFGGDLSLEFVSPLAIAVASNDINLSICLLEAGIDINAADSSYMLLLEHAVENKSLKLCELLIENGAKTDRSVQSRSDNSPLVRAILHDSYPIFELLVSSGARVNDRYSMLPGSALGAALESGNLAVIERLLQLGASLDETSMRIPNLPTMAILQQEGILKNILQVDGAKILEAALMANEYDAELFHWLLVEIQQLVSDAIIKHEEFYDTLSNLTLLAVQSAKLDGLQLLLSYGPLVGDKLLLAAWEQSRKDPKLFDCLLPNCEGNVPSTICATILSYHCIAQVPVEFRRRMDRDLYEKILRLKQYNLSPKGFPVLLKSRDPFLDEIFRSKDVDLDRPDVFDSALDTAVFVKDIRLLQMMIEWANWAPQEVSGALVRAILLKNIDIIKLLMELSPDLNQEILVLSLITMLRKRLTPLKAAIGSQMVSVVRIVAPLVDVNFLGGDIMGRTALQMAAELSNLDIIEILLENGAMVDGPIATDGGVTPLQMAAIKGDFGIAWKLIDLGADVNHAPARFNGRTALQGAAEYGRIDILKMLIDRGALTSGEWYDEAIELAEENGKFSAAGLLRSFTGADN